MIIHIFFYVVLACMCRRAEGTEVGNGGIQNAGRVINGKAADINHYPYVVAIQHYDKDGKFWYYRCVGSIMNANTILTACHCIRAAPLTDDHIEIKDMKEIRVLAGVADRYDEAKAQIVGVKQLVPHPQCTSPPGAGGTDVAVIKLESDLDLTVEGVKSIQLFSKDPKVVVEEQKKLVNSGANCLDMGWGLDKAPPNNKSLDALQATTLHLINNKECSRLWCENDGFYCDEDLDKYNFICAVNNNSTLCRGDSGSPLVCNGNVFGVHSLGDLTCRVEVPIISFDVNSILYFADMF